MPGHSVNRAALFQRLRRGDKRAAVQTGFHYENAVTPPSDDPVAHRKSLSIGFNAHRKLRHDCAVSVPNSICKRSVFRRIEFGQSRADYRDRPSFCGERPLMRSGVDSACQPADYCQSGVSQLIGQLLRRLHSIMCGAPCTDDSDGMMIALLQFAPHVEHDWWCMDFTQRPGIRW